MDRGGRLWLWASLSGYLVSEVSGIPLECTIWLAVKHEREKCLEYSGLDNQTTGCQSMFDNITCWPAASEGEIKVVPCPKYFALFSTVQGNVSRNCTSDGWSELQPASYFAACGYDPNITSPDESVFYDSVKTGYTIGHSLSLVALTMAVLVLCIFRKLHCTRNYIHMHLFVSFIMRAIAVFVKDFILFESEELDHCHVSTFHFGFAWRFIDDRALALVIVVSAVVFYCFISLERAWNTLWRKGLVSSTAVQMLGIVPLQGCFGAIWLTWHITALSQRRHQILVELLPACPILYFGSLLAPWISPSVPWITSSEFICTYRVAFLHTTGKVGCKAAMVFFQYCIMANFFWLLVEGLYLHTLLVISFFSEKKYFWWYILIGWGAPTLFTSAWAIVKVHFDDVGCWDLIEHYYWWIIKAPILVSILVNFVLFICIIRILVQKLHSPDVGRNETSQYSRLAKSTLLLIPLFGIHYIFFAFFPDTAKKEIRGVKLVFELVLGSFQGFVVAVLYCFLNGEVQAELKRKWRRWHMERFLGSDMKYHHPSLGSNGTNFSTQISMLTKCSPKTRRCSSFQADLSLV